MLFVRHTLNLLSQNRINRWAGDTEEKFVSSEKLSVRRESVLEHNGAMVLLTAMLFRKAEVEGDESFSSLNFQRITELTSIHDSEELLTGDVREKDDEHYKKEERAREAINKESESLNFGSSMIDLTNEYSAKNTKEARFVKALDLMQAFLYMIQTRSLDEVKESINLEDPMSMKGYKYAQEFETLKRVFDVVIRLVRRKEVFSDKAPEMEQEKD